jgi:acyl dehydratase
MPPHKKASPALTGKAFTRQQRSPSMASVHHSACYRIVGRVLLSLILLALSWKRPPKGGARVRAACGGTDTRPAEGWAAVAPRCAGRNITEKLRSSFLHLISRYRLPVPSLL